MSATIRYPTPDDGSPVSIAGNFNDWQPQPMQLSKDGKFYQKVVKKTSEQAEKVVYKFLLESGEWALHDGLPTTPDENGQLNHKAEFETNPLGSALDEALEKRDEVDGKDHVARPEKIRASSDVGREVIDQNTSNNDYPAEQRNTSGSGPGLVDADQQNLTLGEHSVSENYMLHDSTLNPTAPAFNPIAQPFVPSSNIPRHSHSASRSSHRQRSQSRSRKSHSRSSSVASQQRPRSGSSVHHEELNPSAHEFKPQFAQPTHHVPHASGYAAALKKPASPPLKDEFKKPHAPTSKGGKARSTSSAPAVVDPVGPVPVHVSNGDGNDSATSYAQMAKHAVEDGPNKKQPSASSPPIVHAEAQKVAVARSQDPALTDAVLKAGAKYLPDASNETRDPVRDSRSKQTAESDSSLADAGAGKISANGIEHVSQAAKSELHQLQESTLEPMVESLKEHASDLKEEIIEPTSDSGQNLLARTTSVLEEAQSDVAGTAQSARDSIAEFSSIVSESTAQASDAASKAFKSTEDAVQDRISSSTTAASSQAKEVVSQGRSAGRSLQTRLDSAGDAAQNQAISLSAAVDERTDAIKEVVSEQAQYVKRTAADGLLSAQELTSDIPETISSSMEPVVATARESASSTASILNEATENVQAAMKTAIAQVNSSVDYITGSDQTSSDHGIKKETAASNIETIDLSSQEYDAEQVRLMEEVCILLDRNDTPIGSVSKKDAHLMANINEGLLHRAFSLFIFNSENKLLLQQRASEKITFPDMWTNTCCSHPLSIQGEVANDLSGSIAGVKVAARRKVEQELGIQAVDAPIERMEFLTRIHYLAPSDGQWGEHEIDYILFLRSDPKLDINPNEVQDDKWVSKEELREMFKSTDLTYTPWFKLICETFLFKWWDNLADLTSCKDEGTIHRLGIEPDLYAKIALSRASTDASQSLRVGAKDIATTVQDKTNEVATVVSQHGEAIAEQITEAKNNLASGVEAVTNSVRNALSSTTHVDERDHRSDPETSEPAAEHSLPISQPTPAPDFDASTEGNTPTSTEDTSSRARVEETAEPAAEDVVLPLTETRDPIESEVQESFDATNTEGDTAQPSKKADAVLEVTPEGQARAAAHAETESTNVSRPSTKKSLRANQNFFFYIFNTLFGGIFKGFSTVFNKLAFWRKSPDLHSD